MRICRKCSQPVSGDSQICRNCGAILEEVQKDEVVRVRTKSEREDARRAFDTQFGSIGCWATTLGACFFVGALLMGGLEWHSITTAESTEGVVIDIDARRAIVRYEVNGKEHFTGESPIYQVGQKVTLQYQPERPDQVKTKGGTWPGVVSLAICGLMLIAPACWSFLAGDTEPDSGNGLPEIQPSVSPEVRVDKRSLRRLKVGGCLVIGLLVFSLLYGVFELHRLLPVWFNGPFPAVIPLIIGGFFWLVCWFKIAGYRCPLCRRRLPDIPEASYYDCSHCNIRWEFDDSKPRTEARASSAHPTPEYE